jgi:hypothetical protein
MAETIDPELLKRLVASGLTDTELQPKAMSPPSLAALGPTREEKGLPVLTPKEQRGLPMLSPGVSAGSSADYENQIEKLRAPREPATTALGKFGRGLEKIGNIAGDIALPGVMANIPGTDMYKRAQIHELGGQLERARAGEATRANLASEQQQAETTEKRLQQHEEFEEGKPEKPGTPDEQAIAAKMNEVNPETKKPFTAYEARISLAQDIENTKPDKTATPHTVTMLDKEGGKPYTYQYDPEKTYAGDEGHDHWKKIGPAKPDALSLGLIGTMQPLLGTNGEIVGTLNSKTGKMSGLTPEQQGAISGTGGTTSSGARLANTQRNQFNTQYINPSNATEVQYQRATEAVDQYNSNPKTGAAAMVLFAQHLGTTLGGIKGAAIGEHSQQLHANAIGLEDRLNRFVDYLKTGQPLSASQVKDFYSLVSETRGLQWDQTLREGIRRGQPVDFLPSGLYRTGKNADGKTVYQRKDEKNAPVIEEK